MDLQKLLKKKKAAKDDGKVRDTANICRELGNYYRLNNQPEKAVKEYLEEIKIFKILNKQIDVAQGNRAVGDTYVEIGKPKEALPYIKEYLSIAKKENDLKEIQRAYTTLGRCYLCNGLDYTHSADDFNLAEKYFLKSLDYCKQLSVSKHELADMQARLYLNIALSKEGLGHFQESVKNYELAIKICKSNDIFDMLHQCLMDIGLNYSKQGDSSLALSSYNEALTVAKRLKNKKEKMCETLLAKSELLVKNGDFQSAKQTLKKAFRIKTPAVDYKEAIEKNLKIVVTICKFEDDLVTTDSFNYKKRRELFEKLGDCACKLKSFTKAIDFYKKTLEAAEFNGESEKELIPIYVSIYSTLNDNKQFEEALEYLWKEHEVVKDEAKEAQQVLSDIADTMNKAGKSFWDVETVYQRALTEARKLSDISVEKLIFQKLIKLCKDNHMESLVDINEKEAKDRGISLEKEESENSEIEGSEDLLFESPDYIDDVDLDALSSEAESSDEDVADKPNVARRSKKKSMITKNEKGETKLHRACIDGNVALVKMLLDQGHPVNLRDNAGWLPLHEAAIDGHVEIVEMLLDNGGQSVINDKGADGITPLFDACSNGHFEVINLLLDRGAKPSITNDHGDTSLHSLDYWYENIGSYENESLYQETRQRLVDQLEKMGLDTKSTGSSSNKSSGNSFKSRNSGRSLSHLVDDYPTQNQNTRTPLLRNRSSNSLPDNDAKKAKLEYKNVMNRLKNRNSVEARPIDLDLNLRRKNAYLESQEIDCDNWLDDDLGPSRKKQKFFNDAILAKSSAPREDVLSFKENISNSFSRRTSNLLDLSSDENEDIDNEPDPVNVEAHKYSSESSNSRDAFDFLMNNENSRKKPSKSKSKNLLSLNKNPSKRISQSSLLEAGFSKFMDVDNDDNFSSISPTKSIHNEQSFTNFNDSYSQRNTSGGSEKQVIIKVQVDTEKIIVPVKQDAINELKISWLIEETSRRYYCIKGIRPELKLTTIDGATLLTSDPIAVILSLTEENFIKSEILDWKLPPLPDRYLEACSEYKKSVDPKISELLDISRALSCLNLNNQNLNTINIRPIFKALQHQNCLTHLDLSNNFIQNEGVKHLSQSLQTLKQLKILNLSGNLINDKGVEFLSNIYEKNSCTLELEELNLSYNPLGSGVFRCLGALLQSSFLSSLSLKSCELQNLCGREMELNFSSLKKLDISYNSFDAPAINYILDKLNPHSLEFLNMEASTNAENIQFPSNSWTSLKDLNLSHLNFNENEILEILRNLENCDNLLQLNLSYLNDLTFLTLKYILFSMNIKLRTVQLIGCKNLTNFGNVINISESGNRKHPKNLYLSYPKKFSEDEKYLFLDSVKILWDKFCGCFGRLKARKNIIKLYVDDGTEQDSEGFLGK